MATTVTTVRKRGFFGWVFPNPFSGLQRVHSPFAFCALGTPIWWIGTNYEWRGVGRWPRHFRLVSGLRYPWLVGLAHTRIEDRHDGKGLSSEVKASIDGRLIQHHWV